MATSPGGKSVGKVSLRAVPDTSTFEADLKKALDTIEKEVSLTVSLGIETKAATAQLETFTKDWSGKNVDLNVGAKTAGADADLDAATRKRTVTIDPKVNDSDLAKAQSELGTLNAGELFGGAARIGVIGSAISALVPIAASLLPLAGLLAAMPGLLGGALAGLAVIVIAFAGAKTQLASLTPVWQNLNNIIQDNFWAKAKAPIIDFIQSVLPQLKTGLAGVSTALGTWTASIANSFKTAFASPALTNMLTDLQQSITIAASGTGGFAQALATLGSFGAQYLPVLAQDFANVANEFSGWLTKVASDGTLTTWVNNGITVFHQLETVLSGALSIVNTIFSAAGQSDGLAILGTVLGSIATALSQPAFTIGLSAFFAGIMGGVQALLPALAPLAQALGPVGTLIGSLASAVGPLLGDALKILAPLLSIVAGALQPVVSALATGLAPAIAACAPILGTLASLFADLIPVITPLIQPVLSIATAILGLAGTLLTALMPSFNAVMPALLAIVQACAPFLTVIGQIITSIGTALAPVIAQLAPLFVTLIEAVTPLITALMPSFVQILQLLEPIIGVAAQILSDVLVPAVSLVSNVLSDLIVFLTDVFQGKWSAAWAEIIKLFTDLWNGVVGVVKGVIDGVIDVINGIIGGINKVTAAGADIGIHIGKIPDIPKLAVGADVTGPTVAMLGEGGQAETVTNLGGTNDLIKQAVALSKRVLSGASSSGSGKTVTQNIYPSEGMSEQTIGQIAANALDFQLRSEL